MHLPVDLSSAGLNSIKTVDMHTTGEPTRIVYAGYPVLCGTLLEQRAEAKSKYDHVRKSLMLEPRGHRDMYGAILRQETELTSSGEAHIGVLFTTNEGYSTMCGHATIALGRFLVDLHHVGIFPRRDELELDPSSQSVELRLHAPCGLVKVTVPTNSDGSRADSSRPVTFLCVPSFAVGTSINIHISDSLRWPELADRRDVVVDLSYGGAFYCMVAASQLGFPHGLTKADTELNALDNASRLLKDAINSDPDVKGLIRHPQHDDLSFLYSVIIVDDGAHHSQSATEIGLCFFGDQQIDRSPTGSGVAARVALAYAKGEREMGERWSYHSLVSRAFRGGAFIGEPVKQIKIASRFGADIDAVIVSVQGHAYYTGFNTFMVEDDDPLAEGFLFNKLSEIQFP
ncbi:putative proline racemase [Venturia nashicola]|uniref:trans-L-3-hydroxyproline dehydratase n=1 Tax=Venturia nashicola TaxID=86259 RepID=A0A4Z1PUX7_9PEZI|nr:putative proline racemase [Venturia nashicola]TLD38728.1 putative proline racemase [Venturia nashicola]